MNYCPKCGKKLTIDDYETYYNEETEDTCYHILCDSCGYNERFDNTERIAGMKTLEELETRYEEIREEFKRTDSFEYMNELNDELIKIKSEISKRKENVK